MKKNDNLNPKINPAEGVKRFNKLPLYIGLGVGSLIIFLIVSGITGRSQKQAERNNAEKDPEDLVIGNDDASMNKLLAGIPSGYVCLLYTSPSPRDRG